MGRDKEDKYDNDIFLDWYSISPTFRGVMKRAVEHIDDFAIAHPECQNALSYETWTKAFNIEPVYRPVAEAAVLFVDHVRERPELFCYPPELPDEWDDFGKVLLKYAPNTWWYETLNLEDICKPSSFQTWLSRPTRPRKADLIIERVSAWRAECIKALDEWVYWTKLTSEHSWFERLAPTLTHEAIERGEDGRETFRKLFLIARYSMTSHSFDPADPQSFPWALIEQPDLIDKADEMFDTFKQDGFGELVSRETKPGWHEDEERKIDYWSNDLRHVWLRLARIRSTFKWCDVQRRFEETRRILEIRCKIKPQGGDVHTHKIRVRVGEIMFIMGKKIRKFGLVDEEFEWAWRPATHDDQKRLFDPLGYDALERSIEGKTDTALAQGKLVLGIEPIGV